MLDWLKRVFTPEAPQAARPPDTTGLVALAAYEGTSEDGREMYAIGADELYPAAVAYVRSLLPAEVAVPANLRIYIEPARRLPAEAWDLALTDKTAVEDAFAPLRVQALQTARLVYTEVLHAYVAYRPLYFHIKRGRRDWRL